MTFVDNPLFGEDLIAPAGRPQRFTTRWRLIGAGLANVWRYGDMQLEAPSGRLLLRGPNGTGKTTALEALWPYLLDLNAQRLAAGKARPTSLSLLMREGADGARRRFGYLWLTIAGPGDGNIHSYGVRLQFSESGSPAVKVVPFTIPGVPLRDMELYGPKRAALNSDQFTDAVTAAGGIVFDDEDAYVAHLAARLWRTDERGLTEMANRIRALRNPTLLGDVSPKAAADTLRDALPGVSDDVVTATADALAESEATRVAFQRDRDAADALARFTEAWAGHVVEIVGEAHKEVTGAVATVAAAERAAGKASETLADAAAQQSGAEEHLSELQGTAEQLEANIHALENSEPYKAAGRLTDLHALVVAEQGAADLVLKAFRSAVGRSRKRAEDLSTTAGDLLSDIEALSAEATAVDIQAMPHRPAMTITSRPRPPYRIGDITVDPGPGTTISVDRTSLGECAATWRQLAEAHQAKGDAARLALTDRRATTDAEDTAGQKKSSAANLRAQSDREQQRLTAATKDARKALGHLIDRINEWYAEHRALADVVEHAHPHDDSGDPWRSPRLDQLDFDDPAAALPVVEDIATALTSTGGAAVAMLRAAAATARREMKRLRGEAATRREEARQLRDGKMLPIPRPAWAGPAPDGETFADAVTWHANLSDPTDRALIENALATSGLLGATLSPDGARTATWYVDATSPPTAPNLAEALSTDHGHPQAAIADHILHRIPLRHTTDSADGPAGLVIGRDGTFTAGPLRGRPPGTDDPLSLPPAEHVGAAQRRAAALARANSLDAEATHLETEARQHETDARRATDDASRVDQAVRRFPSRTAAAHAEATRAATATRASGLASEAGSAETEAAELEATALGLRLEWEQRTRARDLPIDLGRLADLRDSAERRTTSLRTLAQRLTDRFKARLDRLTATADEDGKLNADLADEHAETTTAVEKARTITAEHQALLTTVGLDAEESVRRHADAIRQRERLTTRLTAAAQQVREAQAAVTRSRIELEAAEQRAHDVRPAVTIAERGLRALTEVPGVPAVLFGSETVDPGDSLVTAVGHALRNRRTTSRRLLRERYDACRAALAGLWTLDPSDTVGNLDTYLLTHDSIAYTPPAAADAGSQLRDRAQKALDQAEESALREFVIGRLPLAIGTAWVGIEDWIKDVNRKMQNAAASSGVGVRIARTLAKDLSAAELTVHRLACKGSILTAEQQAEVGEALRSLIAAADGATMTEKLANAIDVRQWLDIWYEILRPNGQTSRWTSKTGLSGGERRLVVLAPMLAAVAAYFDQLDTTGPRLIALDEVPAEVDERGREGLARYIADLDLDLICTSYLWDGAPGAWDGIDAWDLEAGPDTTVVAFPMLIRGLTPLPGDDLS
ncbi:SbcC/MukB-like Walker B domain-containing protein [Actinoplanes sp. CA-252034]|uniref:SbcC/MukB-like Walker B domain-containing protein n=1 Tax=Actinoplanes sp. CA-252034 TaxID=3239906 RepID=UPI003D962B36